MFLRIFSLFYVTLDHLLYFRQFLWPKIKNFKYLIRLIYSIAKLGFGTDKRFDSFQIIDVMASQPARHYSLAICLTTIIIHFFRIHCLHNQSQHKNVYITRLNRRAGTLLYTVFTTVVQRQYIISIKKEMIKLRQGSY